MLSAGILSMKMPLSEALAVSLIGIVTVIIILAVIAILILLVSKAIRALEAKASSAKTETPSSVAPVTDGVTAGQVELIGTEEKEAAVIMAIVSQKSGIPLERLSFKSIRLMDEEKKGDESK